MATVDQLDEIEACLEAMGQAIGRAREGELEDDELWGELEAQCQNMATIATVGDVADEDDEDADDDEDELDFDALDEDDDEGDEDEAWSGEAEH